VRGECGRSVVASVADCALEWLPVIMCLEVNFKMIATRKGAGTMLALVSFVASVQFNMSVATSFVLEWSITIIAGVNGALVIVMVVVIAAG